MEKLFKLKQYGTNVRTEIIAGITTFFTMAYIIFVNPEHPFTCRNSEQSF